MRIKLIGLVGLMVASMGACSSNGSIPKPSPTIINGPVTFVYDAPTTGAERQEDCEALANLAVTVEPSSTGAWPGRAQADYRPWNQPPNTAFTKTSDLVVTTKDGSLTWTVAEGVQICGGVVAVRNSAKPGESPRTGVFKKLSHINQQMGMFHLPANADGVTLYGWQPKLTPGEGIISSDAKPSDYTTAQLDQCVGHGNVVATVRRNAKTGRWEPATVHTIVKGASTSTANSLKLVGRNNLAHYYARSGVTVCQLEFAYDYGQGSVTSVNEVNRNYVAPRANLLTSVSVLAFDPALSANGEGDLTRHSHR